MRILIVITGGNEIGGAQVHVRDLSRELRRRHHELLVAIGRPGPLSDMLDEIPVSWTICHGLQRDIGPRQDLEALGSLHRIVRAFGPHLISAHTTKAGVLARMISRLSRIPCVVNPHGWSFTEGVPKRQQHTYRLIERAMARMTDRIICVSDYDRCLGIRAGIPGSRLVTVRNGVPDVPFRLRARVSRAEPVRVAMVARFSAQKDHSTLIRAVGAVEGMELYLVGDGPLLGAAREESRRLGMSQRVHFLGQRTDVAQILANMQIFALISRWEGFPLSTLEAMRAGLPVVVSDVGGAGEAFTHGVSGFRVRPGDVAGVRAYLTRLAVDASLRASMGKAARRRYEEAFTFDSMFERTCSVYQDAVAGIRW